MSEELKPCPFCGGLGELIRETVTDEILYAVVCSCWHCRVGPITDWYQVKEHAIEAWNKGGLMIIKEWEHAGMTCALRHGVFGEPCGYVSLPDSHKQHGKDARTEDGNVDVHRGFWVGLDMEHPWDFDPLDLSRCIRTEEECIAETNRLAEQLAKMEVS